MIEVKIGQVWKDCDKRMGNRFLLVTAIEEGRAYCLPCRDNGQVITTRGTRIRLDRFKPTSTGFELVGK